MSISHVYRDCNKSIKPTNHIYCGCCQCNKQIELTLNQPIVGFSLCWYLLLWVCQKKKTKKTTEIRKISSNKKTNIKNRTRFYLTKCCWKINGSTDRSNKLSAQTVQAKDIFFFFFFSKFFFTNSESGTPLSSSGAEWQFKIILALHCDGDTLAPTYWHSLTFT